jgi:aconitate hydratase
VATSVLSGNRNFEGRISPDVKANYLASPRWWWHTPSKARWTGTRPTNRSAPTGRQRRLPADLWPTQSEIDAIVAEHVTKTQFVEKYADVFSGAEEWQSIDTSGGALYDWDEDSTYVQEPPFFLDLSGGEPLAPIDGARVLAKLGDSVTTDHISPAGSIKVDSPAGQYLISKGVQPAMFNSYGSRRGNDRVMTRGTFANIRVRNQLAPGTEGGRHRRLDRRPRSSRSTTRR